MYRLASSARACAIAAAIAGLAGCISRTLEIRSEPPGARVYFDGQELARTPVSHPFKEYGHHRLLIAKEGHEPVSEIVHIAAPWWCWFPIDLFVELWPFEVVDRHEYAAALTASGEVDTSVDRMLLNLDKLRQKMRPED
jgi:hypothetical protein